jgi:hypothetical protein
VKKRNTFYSFGVATEKDVVMIRSGASLQLWSVDELQVPLWL